MVVRRGDATIQRARSAKRSPGWEQGEISRHRQHRHVCVPMGAVVSVVTGGRRLEVPRTHPRNDYRDEQRGERMASIANPMPAA
jgi:hypothetical protein